MPQFRVNTYCRIDTLSLPCRPVPTKKPKAPRKLPARISVPVSDADACYIERLQVKMHLRMSALSRLLFHRGIEAHRRDGRLSE